MRKILPLVGAVAALLVIVFLAWYFELFRIGQSDRESNSPPKATFTHQPEKGQAPLEVAFDGSASSDPDEDDLSFIWDFGDGGEATGAAADHTYSVAGTYTVKLTVTDEREASHSVSKKVIVQPLPPMLSMIQPADGATIHGSKAWIRWETPSEETKGTVLWRRQGKGEFKTADAGTGASLDATLKPLQAGATYEYVVQQQTGDLVQQSELRTFTVKQELVFEPPTIEKTISRDYNQTITFKFRNNSDKNVTVASKAVKEFDELPADVVGKGSVDEPVELKPGQAVDLKLVVAAVDAEQKTYEIPIEAAGATALAKVTIDEPRFDLAFRIVKTDPHTLAQTIEIKNNGDTLNDLAVHITPPNDKEIRLQPIAHHARLSAGRTMEVTASPVLYFEFQALKAQLQCTAAGKSASFDLEFEAPPGQRLIGVRTGSSESSEGDDWYCTNKPKTCSDLPGPGGNGPARPPDITSQAARLWQGNIPVEVAKAKPRSAFPLARIDSQDLFFVGCCGLVRPVSLLPALTGGAGNGNGGQGGAGGAAVYPCQPEPGQCPPRAKRTWIDICSQEAARLRTEWNAVVNRLEQVQSFGPEWDEEEAELQQRLEELNEQWNIRYQECLAKGVCIGRIDRNDPVGPLGNGIPPLEEVKNEEINKAKCKARYHRAEAQRLRDEGDLLADSASLIPGVGDAIALAIREEYRQKAREHEDLARGQEARADELANDPPRKDYDQIAQPGIEAVAIDKDAHQVPRRGAEVTKALRWEAAFLQAHTLSFQRFQGARDAKDMEAMKRQAKAMERFAELGLQASRRAALKEFEFQKELYQLLQGAQDELGGKKQSERFKMWLSRTEKRLASIEAIREYLAPRKFDSLWPPPKDTTTWLSTAQLSRRFYYDVVNQSKKEGRINLGTGVRLRPGLLEALSRRAAFTRENRGPFAAPLDGNAPDTGDFAAGFHGGDRVCFAWHQAPDTIVFASFDPRGEVLLPPHEIGKGRWPRIAADGKRTAIAWEGKLGFVVRIHDGKQWGKEIGLTGREASLAFAPGGQLYAATTTGLWKLANGKFEQVDKKGYRQPALAFDKDGKAHVGWENNGNILVDGQQVGKGHKPTLLIRSKSVHLAYVQNGSLLVQTQQNGKWSKPEQIPAKEPAWPALASGKDEVRLTYLGAADKGPEALWLVRLPDKTPILMPSLAGNITEAWLTLNFGLKYPRSRYRPHDVLVTVNDVWVKMFENTVPDGRYLFRLHPYQIFTSSGRPVPNRIGIQSRHMNGGHYAVSSDYQLTVRKAWSEYFAFAGDQQEVIQASESDRHINHDQPDLVLLANSLDLPAAPPESGPIDFPVTIANVGEAVSKPAKFVMSYADETLAESEIPPLQPGEQRLVTVQIDKHLPRVHFAINQEKDFDPSNDTLALYLWDRTAKEVNGTVVMKPVDAAPPWVNGELPFGAKAIGDWNWHEHPALMAPRSHAGPAAKGPSLHYFIRAQLPLVLTKDHNLVQYVYLNPKSPPKQILLQLYKDGAQLGKRIYWGDDLIRLGAGSGVHMGALPKTGQWVRLRIPLKRFDLKEAQFTGMVFGQYDGRAFWGVTTASPMKQDKSPEVMLLKR